MQNRKIVNVVALSGLISGLVITASDPYTPKIFGIVLLIASSLLLYISYIKNHELSNLSQKPNFKQSFLGLLLILIDISYNLLADSPFKSFDITVLLSGTFVLTLNLGLLNFLKLDEKMTRFTSYFLFIIIGLYGFLFTGLNTFFGDSKGSNFFWEWFNNNVVYISMPFLNLVRPTTINGNIINFDGFSVGIGYACSGVESLSVFFAAVIAYFIAKKEYNVSKIVKFMLIGGITLYILNILRVLIIIFVGYFHGIDTMMFVHTHLGWIFFLIGMSIFWYLVLEDTTKL